MSDRKKISDKTKLAAALLTLGDVPYEDAKQMTADQIVSLYQFDHFPILHGIEAIDEPWNLVPRLIIPHRKKSGIDKGIIAKVGRIARKHARITKLQTAPTQEPSKPERRRKKIPSRPFPKQKIPWPKKWKR